MAIAFVQRKVGPGAGTTSSYATGTFTSTAGNLLVMLIQAQLQNGVTSISSVTNVGGDTFTATAKSPFNNFNNTNAQAVYYAKNIAGNASDNVTVAFSGSTGYVCGAVYEFSGADLSAPLVADATGTAATGAITTTSITLGGVTCALVGIFETDASGTAGAGFTGFSTDGSLFVKDEYQITSTDQPVTATGGTAGTWGIIGAAFKSAGAGASTWGPLLGLQNNRLVVAS